ncbi:hypothetical protein HAX54_013243, partial [Datura stramonium]|nr:hypothetical protein [Datura stramonium]
ALQHTDRRDVRLDDTPYGAKHRPHTAGTGVMRRGCPGPKYLLNMDYPLGEHFRALYKVGQVLRSSLMIILSMRSKLELTPIWSLMVMMETTQRWEKLLMPPTNDED